MKQIITDALAKQFNEELYSAYLYLSISSYCEREGFAGIANWFYVQAQEEMAHAMHLYQYILERGSVPALQDVRASKAEYSAVQDVFAVSLAHEKTLSAGINSLSTLAMKEEDHATYQFMQWYVREQVEEEATVSLLLSKVQHVGDNKSQLFMLDNELAARVYVDPFTQASTF